MCVFQRRESFMKRSRLLLVFTSALILASAASAQQIKSNTMVSIPTGPDTVTFTVDKGEIISKNSVSIKFVPDVDKTGNIVGYKYDAVGIDALKVGDQVPIFIHKLGYGIGYGGVRDDSGGKVFWGTFGTNLSGAFKPVTIESVKRVANTLTINFHETATLSDKTTTKLIKLALKDGWYSVPPK